MRSCRCSCRMIAKILVELGRELSVRSLKQLKQTRENERYMVSLPASDHKPSICKVPQLAMSRCQHGTQTLTLPPTLYSNSWCLMSPRTVIMRGLEIIVESYHFDPANVSTWRWSASFVSRWMGGWRQFSRAGQLYEAVFPAFRMSLFFQIYKN